MLQDEPTILPDIYRLPADPVGEKILVPAFKQAVAVRGAFGWFSAGWIRVLSHGLASYLERDSVEPIHFLISPALFPEERKAVIEAMEDPDEVMRRFEREITAAKSPDADALSHHAVDCLAWMLANGRMKLDIAVVAADSNYHPKIWIFSDGQDVVTVRGSANATGRAYERAVEHMDVDCSWDNQRRVTAAIRMVDDWFRGSDPAVRAVVPLSEAVRQRIVGMAPAMRPSPDDYRRARGLDSNQPDIVPEFSENKTKTMFHIPENLVWETGTYAHQGEAVRSWELAGRRGVLAMATGAGKTISALVAAHRLAHESADSLLVVISAPSNPLVQQWKAECARFGLKATIPNESPSKSAKHGAVGDALMRLRSDGVGKTEVLIVTNRLISSPSFIDLIGNELSRNSALRSLHIADEAHSLGTASFLSNTPDFFHYRLGLSATPERQYDDEGTAQLFEYFGKTVFEFGLDKAIGFCLVPYDYHVYVAHLNSQEKLNFLALSLKISRLVASSGSVNFSDERLTKLLVERRGILESTESKTNVLRSILKRRRGIRNALVYTTSKNPSQLEEAIQVATSCGIVAKKVTEVESADRRLLQDILKAFDDGDIELLVAKRVLDEGVDIPATKEAILMASSTVEREWIQRRGRVLRRHPGKSKAVLHDIISLPPPGPDFSNNDSLINLVSNELDRVRAFARHALNRKECLDWVQEVHSTYFKI